MKLYLFIWLQFVFILQWVTTDALTSTCAFMCVCVTQKLVEIVWLIWMAFWTPWATRQISNKITVFRGKHDTEMISKQGKAVRPERTTLPPCRSRINSKLTEKKYYVIRDDVVISNVYVCGCVCIQWAFTRVYGCRANKKEEEEGNTRNRWSSTSFHIYLPILSIHHTRTNTTEFTFSFDDD